MKLSLVRSLALLAVAFTACSTPSDKPARAADETAAAAWTQTFLDDTVLSAADVRIEGPPGLREHVVVVQDPDNHSFEVHTTADGLLTEARIKPDGLGNAIHAQLDKLVIAADRSIVVLERPGHVRVTVDASGDVYFCRVQTRDEQRSPTLRIVGAPAQ
jgi:hypothetical protein